MVKWFPIIAGIVGLAWFWMGPEPEETGRSYRGGPVPVTIVQEIGRASCRERV